MKRKLGGGALFPLVDRCAVIDRATRESDWLMTAREGLKTQQLFTFIADSIRSALGWSCVTRSETTDEKSVKKGLLDSLEYELVFVCGIDSARDIIKRLPREMKFARVRRPNYDEAIAHFDQHLASCENGTIEDGDLDLGLPNPKRIYLISEWKGPDISSTQIRNCMKARDYEALEEMMNNASIDYLRENATELHKKLFNL
jgi:nicotinic acid mononucleotide adenylyltransferase